jgi:hypothetical protein
MLKQSDNNPQGEAQPNNNTEEYGKKKNKVKKNG